MSEVISVLLAEDDKVQRKIVQTQLERVENSPFVVHNVGSLQEVIEFLNEHAIDVVLLDLGLSDSQGFATVEKMVERHKSVPVVILTATDDKKLALDSLRKGAQDYLVKGGFDQRLLQRVLLYAIERKRGEEELRAAQEKALQGAKFESIARLARGVAHEVLNPLAIIKLGINLLDSKDGKPQEADPEQVALMRDAIERADKVIKGMLAFSDPHAEASTFQSLTGVVKDTLLLLEHDCQQRAISITKELDESLPPFVMQRQKVQQAVLNILNNAIDAMDKSGTLTVRTEHSKLSDGRGGIALVVEDTGPGMSEEDLAQMADPFATKKKTWESFGLGLSVVHKVMQEHGGELNIENRKQGGLRVQLIFMGAEAKS